jgi:hypothetical protein
MTEVIMPRMPMPKGMPAMVLADQWTVGGEVQAMMIRERGRRAAEICSGDEVATLDGGSVDDEGKKEEGEGKGTHDGKVQTSLRRGSSGRRSESGFSVEASRVTGDGYADE